jgi:ADP-ribosylglycohydrolase
MMSFTNRSSHDRAQDPLDVLADRVAGAIVGLAIGDALGYPHEFRSVAQVRREIGPDGVTDFLRLKDPRFSRPFIVGTDHPPGTFTDDTQMSIAVAEALVASGRKTRAVLFDDMSRRFVDWFFSDDNDRSPGAATGTACEALRDGVHWRVSGVRDSKGCGANMRVAPIGLYFDDLDVVADVARACARITHGHPCGVEGAAAAALCVAFSLRGLSPPEIHAEVWPHIVGRGAVALETLWQRLPQLVHREPGEVLVDLEKNPDGLGESWVAEEAIASALYCVWRHPDDYRACVLEAVNTDGDSDSIACIAGGIIGARVGLSRIPPAWVNGVERSAFLRKLATSVAQSRLASPG